MNNLPWAWLAVVVLCVVLEGLTQSLTTIWFACGALVMVVLSLFPVPCVVQVLLFALISLALLAATRPFVRARLQVRRTATNADSLIGRRAPLSGAVSATQKGRVRFNGIEWSVRTADGSALEAGTLCEVVAIEGATLVVTRA